MPRQLTTVTVERTCETCGKKFSFRAYPSWQTGRRFCSRTCIRLDGRPPTPLAERFRKFVAPPDANGCWLWTGSLDKGYGKIGAGQRGLAPLQAHRVAWELANGPIPEGLCVLHNCPG